MNNAEQTVPAQIASPAAIETAHTEEGRVRGQIERLFRLRGDSAAMRLLEQTVLKYRLEQRR